MGRIFFMSDIHGRFDLLMKKLREVNFNNRDYLYILGDVIDRGDESIKLLEFIMDNENIEMILGNHELMMLLSLKYSKEEEDFFKDESSNYLRTWLLAGGSKTYYDFSKLNISKKKKIIYFLQNIEAYKRLTHNEYNIFLSHSGINPEKTLESQSINDLVWNRESFYKNKALENYFYIFGHTPTKYINTDGSDTIWFDKKHKDKINIDLNAPFSNKLGLIEIEDVISLIQKYKYGLV